MISFLISYITHRSLFFSLISFFATFPVIAVKLLLRYHTEPSIIAMSQSVKGCDSSGKCSLSGSMIDLKIKVSLTSCTNDSFSLFV